MKDLTFDPERHAYYARGLEIPGVTQVMGGLNDFLGLDPDVLEAARDRGTRVHEATVAYDCSGHRLEASSLRLYLDAWTQFRADTGFAPTAIEEQVYSERHRYAGTVDRVGPLKGVLAIIDIKTTTAMNPVTALQLAAYQEAYNAGRKEKAQERWAVQLRKDGTYRLHQYKDRADLSVFLACVQIFNWKERNLRR